MSHGTLAENVRAELAAISPTQRCDRLAEISGLFHTAGSLHLRGRGRLAFHLDLASNAVARRAFALLRSVRIDSEIRTYRRRAFDLATRYQLPRPADFFTPVQWSTWSKWSKRSVRATSRDCSLLSPCGRGYAALRAQRSRRSW